MNSKTNTVRAILLDASECDRPEADHPATIEICADDLQRILERHITEPAQCLLQIAEPATAGTAVRAFRDYLGVHDGIKLGGQAMDDMALDLARIALDFKHLVEPQHPDDAAVDALAVLMKAKLAKQRAKGYGGWNDKIQCTQQRLSTFLRTHVDKGDPVDVANFCAMLSARGEGIAAAPQAVQPTVPMFWVRLCRGGMFEGPVHNNSDSGKLLREEKPGEWFPLYLHAAPAHPAEGVPAQPGKPLRDLALGVTSFLDHAGFDTSHLPAGMGAALRRLRDAAIATQPAAQGLDAQLVAFIEKVRDFKAQAVQAGFGGPIRWDIEYGHYGEEVNGKTLPDAITKALAAQAKQGGA